MRIMKRSEMVRIVSVFLSVVSVFNRRPLMLLKKEVRKVKDSYVNISYLIHPKDAAYLHRWTKNKIL